MASNTENLNLLMKNPSTDGADTFNVQTMLNENWQKIDNNAGTVAQTLANILKPTTPPIIGLPPSTTPDGMFQALGNTGELHVWRKTVTTAQGIPAGYTLGSLESGTIYVAAGTGHSVNLYYSSTVNVLDDGSLVDINTGSSVFNIYYGNPLPDVLKGKFVQVSREDKTYAGRPLDDGKIYYIPPTATFSNSIATLNQLQTVTGYAKVPAGTTTTYPVSTNPKAYQEGDDAKAAGYVVGEPKTTVIPIHPGNTIDPFYYGDANNVAVTDDGVVSVSSRTYVSLSPYNTNNTDSVKGKYIQGYPTGYPVTSVYYIPADATFSNAKGELVCDKAQLVTGYAAIPAGTTIEYLGKLGDKARVQVVSYVGTGTYGSGNPNSLTFDFVPKAVFLFSADTYNKCFVAYGDTTGFVFDTDANIILHVSWNGKNISWFNTNNELRQHNKSGYKYRAIAIG